MLHLTAQDAEDLNVISAQMQDAVLRFADISFDTKRRRFTLVANRFAWDQVDSKQRRRTGLHFDFVSSVQKQGFFNVGPDTILSLLAIRFEPKDELSGHITLAFSAGHQLRLAVECVDATLADMGPAWATATTPQHEA
ncbi:MAG: DUF2948 family protein [Alphaproteobacteria bacterium]|nr:DUF2948 family protein [Alphaproteobacteria bacterium]